MKASRHWVLRAGVLFALATVLLSTPGAAQVTTTTTFVPRFEAVAETRLLMEGLGHSNYRSLNRLLKAKPTDVETWSFARGQAILIAEMGNLLLLRPPRNSGRDTWMKLAMDMRSQATTLARFAGGRDHVRSKSALNNLTTACNRCHQTFRVAAKVVPDPEPGERDTE